MIPGIIASSISLGQILYNEGTQVVPLNASYSLGSNGTVNFNSNHIYLSAGAFDTAANERSIRTTSMISLTGVKKIYIDWNGSSSGIAQVIALIVTTTATATYTTNNAVLSVASPNFARRIDSLDVTALSCNYYVKVHARDSRTVSGLNTCSTNVYAIYLEY